MFGSMPAAATAVLAARWAAAAAAQKPEPAIATVVATGLILVFGILFLLYFILLAEGRLFTSLDKKKTAKEEAQTSGVASATRAPVASVAAATAAPAVGGGLQPHVVAAIAAAVAEADGGKYTVASIVPLGGAGAPAASRRGRWGQAGVVQHTEPF